MRIAAITKFKHGKLYELLRKLGWTQGELARRSGLHACIVGDIINLKRRPTKEKADAIQRALGEAGVFFDVLSEWPEIFRGLKRGAKVEQIGEIEPERLLNDPEVLQIEAPDYSRSEELLGHLEKAVQSLPPKERLVIEECVMNGKTYDETGRKFGVSRERIRQIQNQTLRRLRRSEGLRDFVDV